MVSVLSAVKRINTPINRPPMKTKTALMSNAMKVSKRKRNEPVRLASKNPTHGIINGAARIPSNRTACESRKNPSPRIAPHASEKTNNSIEG